MNEWTKFEDKRPDLGMQVWWSDHNNVQQFLYLGTQNSNFRKGTVWKYADFPEVPKNEHHCILGYFECYSAAAGNLLLRCRFLGLHDKGVCCGYEKVKFCPFCGEESPK